MVTQLIVASCQNNISLGSADGDTVRLAKWSAHKITILYKRTRSNLLEAGCRVCTQAYHTLDKKHSIDTPIILRVVCDLCILAPYHFATRCDQSQLTDIDLNDGSLCNDPQRSI